KADIGSSCSCYEWMDKLSRQQRRSQIGRCRGPNKKEARGGRFAKFDHRLVALTPYLPLSVLELLEQIRHRRIARHRRVGRVSLLVELVVEVATDHVECHLLGGAR